MKYILDIPITYPGNVQRTYDLIVPEGNPSDIPLLIWIHGGSWRGGEKRIQNEFERFIYHGFAVLSIDYRFSHEAPFPAQLEDCKTAIRWARAHAEEYGYNGDNIIAGGNSAGGHLAALLGATNGRTEYDVGHYMEYSSGVQAVVNLYGPTDLRDIPPLQPDVELLVNGDMDLAATASPICYDLKGAPDYLLAFGTAEGCIPLEKQGRTFRDALIGAGVKVTYLEIEGGGHGFDCLEFYNIMNEFMEAHK